MPVPDQLSDHSASQSPSQPEEPSSAAQCSRPPASPAPTALGEIQNGEMKNGRSWSDLPVELLSLCLGRLRFADHIRSGSVCMSWRMVALTVGMRHRQALHLPWLMQPTETDPTETDPPTWHLFSPLEGTTYVLTLQMDPNTLCLGGLAGWLATTGPHGQGMHLLNPFTQKLIRLPVEMLPPHRPQQQIFCLDALHKVFLSSSPLADHCILVAMYGYNRMAFCRPGDEMWSPFSDFRFEDVMFCEGLLYGLNRESEIMVFEFNPKPKLKKIIRPTLRAGENLPDEDHIFTRYIVQSVNEELLMIIKYKIPGHGITFSLFKLDGSEWVRMTSLGDEILFLGAGCSRSFTAVEAPELQQNCIYFFGDAFMQSERYAIDDDCGSFIEPYYNCEFNDSGVFSVEDGQIQPDLPARDEWWCRPLWFLLN